MERVVNDDLEPTEQDEWEAAGDGWMEPTDAEPTRNPDGSITVPAGYTGPLPRTHSEGATDQRSEADRMTIEDQLLAASNSKSTSTPDEEVWTKLYGLTAKDVGVIARYVGVPMEKVFRIVELTRSVAALQSPEPVDATEKEPQDAE